MRLHYRTGTGTHDYDRGRHTERVIRMMIAISSKSMTNPELREMFGVSRKTVFRDLNIIERIAPLIVTRENDMDMTTCNRYRIDSHFMRRFM